MSETTDRGIQKASMWRHRNTLLTLLLFLLPLLVCLSSCTSNEQLRGGDQRIIGAKIYAFEGDARELFDEWKRIGIDTAFVGADLDSNPEFQKLAKEFGIKRFTILPTFFNSDFLKENPDFYSITDQGEKAIDDWLEFVCPSREDYREKHINYVRRIVTEHKPDGISIDFIRHFVYWEQVFPDRTLSSIPNSCFDDPCMQKFEQDTGIKLPAVLDTASAKANWLIENHLNEWVTWKCNLISDMVRAIAGAAREVQPELQVNFHAVPWRSGDFGGALRIVAGQDLPAVSSAVDFVSPMCYHHMLKRKPGWIPSVVQDMHQQSSADILPSIQIRESYLKEELTVEAFKEALEAALQPPSRGVVFWSWEALAGDSRKKRVVLNLCKR